MRATITLSPRGGRRGFTLVEMLVAIAIIIALASIMLLFNPKLEKRLASRGADQLQTYLASARSRAVRDNVPCGVRLLSLDSNQTFREFQLVQAPEAFAPTQATLYIAAGSLTAYFDVTLIGSVQQYDMLEILEG